jgi:hypothetical protein
MQCDIYFVREITDSYQMFYLYLQLNTDTEYRILNKEY